MVPMEGGHTQIPRASKGPARVSGSSAQAASTCQPDGALGESPCPGRASKGPAWVWGSSVKGGHDLPARWRPGREPLSRAVQGPGISPPGGGVLFKNFSESWDEVLPVWNC